MSVAGAGLVDENQAFWVQLALARTPLIPRLGHIWPILLGSSLRFFLSESLRKLSLFHRHPTLTLTFRSASSQACKFGERDVGLGRNAFTKGIIMRRQLRFGTAAGSACGYFAGYASPDQSLVNIGDADSKQRRGHIRASSRINCRNHTLTQVLRIWLAHYGLRIDSTRKSNHKSSTARNPPIPSTLKML